MMESQDILRTRVLLCFVNMDSDNCTVTGIAKVLGEEKYTISRILTSLEKEGIVDRTDIRNPKLTEQGEKLGQYYRERVEWVTEYLTQKGLDAISVRQDALHWALYSSDAAMKIMMEFCEKIRLKQSVKDKKQFRGDMLVKKMKDGNYYLDFLIYKECGCNGNLLSMANAGFENPCVLEVKEGKAVLHLRAKEISAISANTKKRICAQAGKLYYCNQGEFVPAEKHGNVFSFPASVLDFVNVTSSKEHLLHGSVRLKMECSAGSIHMPESTALFTVLI